MISFLKLLSKDESQEEKQQNVNKNSNREEAIWDD